jgi:hypothetical protein
MIHYVTLYVTQPNIISKQQGDTFKHKNLITEHGDKNHKLNLKDKNMDEQALLSGFGHVK